VTRAALVVALAALVLAGNASATTLELDRTRVSTAIGRDFTFATTIRNTESREVSGLVAHLNVLSADPGTYVDPEDWSSNRTRYLPPLPPNRSTRIRWTVKAVNSGNIAIYVAVLPRHGPGAVATSAPLRVKIAARRTLNASGVLPLALGIPGVLGAAAVGIRSRRRCGDPRG
jgi:hypothetical protein